MTKVVRLILGIGLTLTSTLLYAGKHPVPLEKNTDSAKCLECHEEKSKGADVHPAIAMGCTTCHEIRAGKDVTWVKLTTTTPRALCFTCHANLNPTDIKGKIHPPALRDCLKCHNPHSSPNKNLLLKPTSGDKAENLCLQCHNEGVDVPPKGSRHAALDGGCETCHNVHKTGERGVEEFDYHLNKPIPALCVECHDPKDASLQKAHQNQPFEKANCVQCHAPHQSASPKLLQKFTHSPFADKSCDTCHAPAKDGKVVLTQSDVKSLCVMCHSEQAEKIEKAKVQHPGAAGDCTDCHNPHASKWPKLPKTTPVQICLNCHTDQVEQGKKAHLHQPAYEQGCSTCHQGHGSENAKLLRTATFNQLCLECHGPDASPTPVKDKKEVTIFNGQVILPDNYFRKVVRLPIKYGLGHPVDHHPVTDQMDPNDVTKVRVAMNCMTCHQPHSSSQPDLLVKDQSNNLMFCASCHKNLGS